MEKENTSIRLRKIMKDRNLRQVDILNLAAPFCEKYGVKMNKSDISQYYAGKTEPNQNKLFVLGKALDVSEAWLMGYDVPMERVDLKAANEYKERMKLYSRNWNIQYFEKEILKTFSQLSDVNKKKVIEYSNNLIQMQQFEEESKAYLIADAAHQRTDISKDELNDKARNNHDDDIMNDQDF